MPVLWSNSKIRQKKRFIVRREDKVSVTGSPELKAMAETPYRPKSVFIRTVKRTENIFHAVQLLWNWTKLE